MQGRRRRRGGWRRSALCSVLLSRVRQEVCAVPHGSNRWQDEAGLARSPVASQWPAWARLWRNPADISVKLILFVTLMLFVMLIILVTLILFVTLIFVTLILP